MNFSFGGWGFVFVLAVFVIVMMIVMKLYRIPIYAVRIGILAPIVFTMMVFPERWIQRWIELIPKSWNKKMGLSFNAMMDFLEGL